MTGVLVAETERGAARSRPDAAGAHRQIGAEADAEAWLAERRNAGSWARRTRRGSGSRAFEAAGVQRVMLQDFLPRDLDMIRLMGRTAT